MRGIIVSSAITRVGVIPNSVINGIIVVSRPTTLQVLAMAGPRDASGVSTR